MTTHRALGRRHLQALLHVRQGDGDDRHVQHDHELGGDGAGHHRSFPALVSLRGSLIRRGVRVVRGAARSGRVEEVFTAEVPPEAVFSLSAAICAPKSKRSFSYVGFMVAQ